MRRIPFLGVVLTLALILAACAPAAATQAPTFPPPVIRDTARPAVVATSAAPAATSTSAAPALSPTAETTTDATADTTATGTAGTVTDASVRIGASTSTSVSQPFLVDQSGRALYLFTEDEQNSGTSACGADCTATWQPLTVKGVPTAGSGVNTGMLGTITREDGTLQASYNGWPLYYYSGDRGVGAMNGQGVDSSWFLVSATGNAIQK